MSPSIALLLVPRTMPRISRTILENKAWQTINLDSPELGIVSSGLTRFAVCSGSRCRERQGFQSTPSLLPPERRCEEKGMLSATQTHLAKELSNDTASTTHDRGHAGEEL